MSIVQRAQKTLFLHFLENFVQSVSKNLKKHCFLTLIAEHHAKISINTVFRIWRTLHGVFKNVKIHCFLTLFVEHHAQSSKNAVFLIFFELCTMCLEKRENTLFSHTFDEHRAKSSKNAIFQI